MKHQLFLTTWRKIKALLRGKLYHVKFSFQTQISCIVELIKLFISCLWDHHLRRWHVLPNLLTDSTKKLPTVGGRGQKLVKICQRLKWMVPIEYESWTFTIVSQKICCLFWSCLVKLKNLRLRKGYLNSPALMLKKIQNWLLYTMSILLIWKILTYQKSETP